MLVLYDSETCLNDWLILIDDRPPLAKVVGHLSLILQLLLLIRVFSLVFFPFLLFL